MNRFSLTDLFLSRNYLLRIYSIALLFSLSLILISENVLAAQGTASTGIWNNSSTWLFDGVARTPACGDTVLIPSGVVVTVNNHNDYTSCDAVMVITVKGTLQFTNGNKMDLPCSSSVVVQSGGIIKKSTPGGGNSTYIKICSCTSWTAGDGTVTGPDVLNCSNGTLPITLLSFTAEVNEERIELKWVTASEINNNYFTLERSADGIEFIPISTVPGNGNSTMQHNYLFEDEQPLNNISYYRLKQTDFDGNYSYSEIIVVKFNSNSSMLKIISCSAENVKMLDLIYYVMNKTETSLSIYDLSGKTIYSTKIYSINGMNHVKMDVPFNNTGCYYLSLSNGSVVVTEKIIFKN